MSHSRCMAIWDPTVIFLKETVFYYIKGALMN
jgi:hypothetical protein